MNNELMRVLCLNGVVSVELDKDSRAADNCDPSVGVHVTVAAGVPTSLDKEIEQLLAEYPSVRITTEKKATGVAYSDTVPTITGWYWRRARHGEQIMHVEPTSISPRHWRQLRADSIEHAEGDTKKQLEALPPETWLVEWAGPLAKPPTSDPTVAYTVSNDGGKTGIYWRDNANECLDYLTPHRETLPDYCVVAVRR